jgi:hypothetical protein
MKTTTGKLKQRTSNTLHPTSKDWIMRALAALDVRGSMLMVGCFPVFLLLAFTAQAEDFGDITVSAHAMYSGQTFHGYAETRVVLQNNSPGKTHVVTLTDPKNAYGNGGNHLSRISRTVALAPGTREIVALLQPPLPINGDSQIRVEVDGRQEGEVRAPNANNHCNTYSRSGQAATVFISRSLDYDAVEQVFHANRGGFTASMAVGAPDATGRGNRPECWMPDTRRSGMTNWLELDYATPQTVSRITIHTTQSPISSGAIILIGASGTNLVRMPLSSSRNTSVPNGWQSELSFAETKEQMLSLRLEFGKLPPYNIAIDAVEIASPSTNQWASDARASSDNSASASSYHSGSMSAVTIQSLRAESPVSEWSENWLAYTPFDIIVLHESDLTTMPAAVFGAVSDYLSAGGRVVVFGQKELPVAWHCAQSKLISDGMEFSVALGHCALFSTLNLGGLSPRTLQHLREAARAETLYWQSLPYDSGAANGMLPVVENLKIPTRGIVVIMVLFIVAIGPVNIILLNRKRRRTWMLWTIPAISFATTLLVFAYSLLREGIRPDTRITGLTVLDQATHHATTVGATAFYCPLTPSGGLQFAYGTEATPLVNNDYSSGTAREMDWSQGQHLQRGWVSARVPAHFHLRKTETRRERLQVISENGQVKAMNSLGAPIKSLWFADAQMKIYEAHNVAAGQMTGLLSAKSATASEKSGAPGLLKEISFVARTDSLAESAANYLTPNSYLAVLDGNPFIENALGSAAKPQRTKSAAVVFGILETPENNGGAQ